MIRFGDYDRRNIPTLINTIHNVIAISVGGVHSMIVNNDGQIYTFGYNFYGQLGLGDNTNRNIQTLIPNIPNIIAITAGRFHSMILNERDQIYTFGHNGYGQLGLGDDTSNHNHNRNTPI